MSIIGGINLGNLKDSGFAGQGALITGGSDYSGGGFSTAYWLTTGSPDNFSAGTGMWG